VIATSPRVLARTSTTVVDVSAQPQATVIGPAVFSTGSWLKRCTSTSSEHPINLAPLAARILSKSDDCPEGVYEFLSERGLSRYHDRVVSWCRDSGAAFLAEVKDNLEELANALKLTDAEKAALQSEPCPKLNVETAAKEILQRGVTIGNESGFPTTPPPVAKVLARTVTVPVTGAEIEKATTRAENAYIPLQAWPVKRLAAAAPSSPNQITSAASPPRQITSSPEHVAAAKMFNSRLQRHSNGLKYDDESPLSRRQKERQSPGFYRMRQWTPPRHRACADTVHVVKMRMANPLAFDVSAAKAAQANLAKPVPVRRSLDLPDDGTQEKRDDLSSFEEVQQAFLRQHGESIRREMPGVRLVPTQVGHHVSQKFMNSIVRKQAEILPAYHGTKASNFSQIQSKGLLVPGHGGVTVANGSVHGVGIYTATLGNSWLSKPFCDSDEMFVCGVVDEKDSPGEPKDDSQVKMAVKAISGQSGPSFHRTSHKPVTSVAVQNKTLGNHTVHRETAHVRHVGAAMVVFDESKVAPLFVAKGIGKPGSSSAQPPALWSSGNSNDQTGACIGGGSWVGTDQVVIGDERFWIPPEDWRDEDDKQLRRRWTAKARHIDRRSRRDMKLSGESQRQ